MFFFFVTDSKLFDLGRAEGTPCTDESFSAWRDRFNTEIEEERLQVKSEGADSSKKKGGAKAEKEVDKSGRLTGFEQFSDKAGTLNLEAMEAAAENAQADVDEELFDVSDDEFDDLDDMDFDDSDDDEDDEPDI